MLKKQPVEIKDLVFFHVLGVIEDMSGIVTHINPFLEREDRVHFTANARIILENQETETTFTYNAITEELHMSGIFAGKWWSRAIVTGILKS